MNKWLYKNAYRIYFYICDIRMSWYVFTKQKEKTAKLITEHINW